MGARPLTFEVVGGDEAPLNAWERAELHALRARVAELEAALRAVRVAAGVVALSEDQLTSKYLTTD